MAKFHEATVCCSLASTGEDHDSGDVKRDISKFTFSGDVTLRSQLVSKRSAMMQALLSFIIRYFRHFTRPSPSSSLLSPLQLPFLDRHATLLTASDLFIVI